MEVEAVVEYFADIPTAVRATILIGGIFLFWVMEGVIPLFQFRYNKIRHAGMNLFFTVLTAIIGFSLAGALYGVSYWATTNGFGVVNWLSMPLWLEVVVGVLFLDLVGAYFAHWTEHQIPLLWRFHLIHHSDQTVDVTTGLRHHPGETLVRISFTIFAVFIAGLSIGIVMLYQSLSVIFAHLTHANINMPERVDRALSYIFITPNMHKVHHHYKLPLTDTNYGNIFALWDRIFGTYAEVNSPKEIRYGIDTHMDPEEHDRLGRLLYLPFTEIRKTEKKQTKE